MTDLQLFKFGNTDVRVIECDGEPWFVAKDVAELLGYSNPRDAVATHCRAAKILTSENATFEIPNRGMTIIPERDVYRLVMRSRLPAAEQFEEWVVADVLPTIRKHGAYMTEQRIEEALSDPDTIIKLATDLKNERASRKAAQEQVTVKDAKLIEQAPKVIFAESIEISKDTILIRELAKLIKAGTSCDIGEKRLFQWMRENGYLIRKIGSDYNMPTQKSMNLGIMVIKEGTRLGTFSSHLTKTTKISGKGQVYFLNKFKEVYPSVEEAA